ncbi:MAG: tetratricopeptide repeat protein, partial [Planctomycetota bacterium]
RHTTRPTRPADPDLRSHYVRKITGALWGAKQYDRSIEILEAEVNAGTKGDYSRARRSLLNSLRAKLIDWKRFVAAEQLVKAELAAVGIELQRRAYRTDLRVVAIRALSVGGRVSYGEGQEIYTSLRSEILQELEERHDADHAKQLVERLLELTRAATIKRVPGALKDLKDFGFRFLPRLIDRYHDYNGQQLVTMVCESIALTKGHERDLISMLLNRAEGEPRWLRRRRSDFWTAHANRFSKWLKDAKDDLGDLESRALAITVENLKSDLERSSMRTRALYYARSRYFWAEKKDAFEAVAMDVVSRVRDSEARLWTVANYLDHGLSNNARAIEVLAAFDRRKKLSRRRLWHLARLLDEENRDADALPYLERLIETNPEATEYRIALIRALHGLEQSERMNAQLDATEKMVSDGANFRTHLAVQLGEVCQEVGDLERGVRILETSITVARRDNHVGPDLARNYGLLAELHGARGNTSGAVKAAAAAIVLWDRHLPARKEALQRLVTVLEKARDLDSWVTKFENELRENKEESPVVRKALGRVYLSRKVYDRAVQQLDLALEHGPYDVDAARWLIDALDGKGDANAAAAKLREFARDAGHEFTLYEELGDRLVKAGDARGAERAYTTLRELSVNETDGRIVLAGVRERQQRWDDAIAEWNQVIRLRTEEPVGYVGLGKALIGAGRKDEGRKVLSDVVAKKWPERFQDVVKETKKLLE